MLHPGYGVVVRMEAERLKSGELLDLVKNPVQRALRQDAFQERE
jgi:hypothetical protein